MGWKGAGVNTFEAPLWGFLVRIIFHSSHDTKEHDQTIENKIHEQDISIDALKITVTAIGVEVKGTESSIAEILAAQNAINATLQVLKDQGETLREQSNGLNTKVDGLTDILRPPRTFPRQ